MGDIFGRVARVATRLADWRGRTWDWPTAELADDRAGAWAIFVAPTSGGEVQKLLDFPKSNPWGTGDREWTNERMSWAP